MREQGGQLQRANIAARYCGQEGRAKCEVWEKGSHCRVCAMCVLAAGGTRRMFMFGSRAAYRPAQMRRAGG